MDEKSIDAALLGLDMVGDVTIADMRARLQDQENLEIAEKARRDTEVARASEDRVPLTPQHWIENDFYAGGMTPYPGGSTYPFLVDLFVKVFELCTFEILLKGASGYGKSSFTRLVEDYCLYLLTCPANPHRSFHRRMNESDPILLLNMNVTKDKAKQAYFVAFRKMVLGSRYYQETCPPRKGLLNRLEFTDKNILCGYTGASRTAAESENLVFVALDEVNLYEDVEKSRRSDEGGGRYDEARVVHTAALRRMQNRFMHPDGSFPPACKMVLLCRETYHDSFMNQRAREIREKEWNKPNKHTGKQRSMIVDLAEWESKPKHFYIQEGVPTKDQWFWIRTSTRTEAAKIIESEKLASDEGTRIAAMVESGEDKKFVPKLVKVPRMGGEYVEAARDNVEGFIRDVCGVPTEAINVFFTDRSVIVDARRKVGDDIFGTAEKVTADLCEHPFTSEVTDFFDGVELIRDRLAVRDDYVMSDGTTVERWRPRVAPNAPRFIHLDMGLTNDPAGMSMVGALGWTKVRRAVFREGDGEEYPAPRSETDRRLPVQSDFQGGVRWVDIKAPHVWHDFTLRCVAPPGGQVPFAALLGIVKALKLMGFRIVLFTMDQYQSAMLLQTVADDYGIETEVASLDRTPDGYKELRRTFVEKRISTYRHDILEGELRALETHQVKKRTGGKEIVIEYIDHPPKAEKDCADSLAGAVWGAARKAVETMKVPMQPEGQKPETKTALQVEHGKMRDARDAMREGRLEDMFDMGKGRGGGWDRG